MKIVISRTDSIGDVILTIPVTGYLKQKFPGCEIFFLGRSYTKAVIELSGNINKFLDWDKIFALNEKGQIDFFKALKIDWFFHIYPNKEIARIVKKAKIPNRVGTSHRTYHWFTCNKLVNFTRKKSNMHESQLNFKLLSHIGINEVPELPVISGFYGINISVKDKVDLPVQPDKNKKNIILHPKSKGSAREWGLKNFGKLIEMLPQEKYKIFISGTAKDENLM